MQPEIVIQATSLITPLGINRIATWDALLAGGGIRTIGRVPLPDPAPPIARVTLLALLAARQALVDAPWAPDATRSPKTALIVGTSKGAVDTWLDRPIIDPTTPTSDNSSSLLESPVRQPYPPQHPLGLHSLAADLAHCLEWGPGPCQTISAACASGLCALAHAALLICVGTIDRALVVGAESSLHPVILQSYRRLGVLAGGLDVTRPFDQNRRGFLVSEAAAAICLERATPQSGDVVINSWATGADASHLTGMAANAPAMRHCLRQAITGPIDLIHAHATGTELNDPIELAAVESVLDHSSTLPAIYSHKGALGHSMGTSGLISTVLNCMMHRAGLILPNCNTPDPIPASRVIISNQPISRPIRHSAVISAGFGGPVAVVTLKTVK